MRTDRSCAARCRVGQVRAASVAAGHVRAVEVQRRARGRRAALPLVARLVLGRTVGLVGRARQLEEAELPDLHARPELDRQGRDVRELERDVAGEARVDEARGRVRQQAEATERALALEPGGDVVGQRHDLERRPEHELAGMQHERLVRVGLDQSGQVGLVDRRVDVRVLVVVEQPEELVQPDVDARRLDERGVVGVEADPARRRAGR